MSSRQKSPITRPLIRRSRSRSVNSRRRIRGTQKKISSRTVVNGGACSSLSDKLEALKNLIPAQNGETVKPDRLFQETADYIVLLKTQVSILQRLVDYYDGSGTQNHNDISV